MLRLVLIKSNLCIKFEVSRFTNSKNTKGSKNHTGIKVHTYVWLQSAVCVCQTSQLCFNIQLQHTHPYKRIHMHMNTLPLPSFNNTHHVPGMIWSCQVSSCARYDLIIPGIIRCQVWSDHALVLGSWRFDS